MEVWKEILGYNGLYEASNMGQIRSVPRNITSKDGRVTYYPQQIIKPIKIKSGYYKVTLWKNRKPKSFGVHVLVYNSFNEVKSNGHKMQVDHINNIPSDNRLENLQLLTCRENVIKSKKDRGIPTGVWKKRNRWCAKIRIGKKQKYLGSFINIEDAGLAYQAAKREIELFYTC